MVRSRLTAALMLLGLPLLAATAYMQVQTADSGDKGWLLLAAHMMLEGRRLYVDIFELNPPLIVWIYLIPAWLAMHTHALGDRQILGLIGLFFSALSVALCTALIRLHPAFAGNVRRQALFALLLAYAFVFFSTQLYFFDRDHIMLVFIFPYLLRFMPALAGQRIGLALRLGVALMAAVGFCIKPHALLVFAAMQALMFLRTHILSAFFCMENAIIGIFAALYLFCIDAFAPEYIHVVFPMALATYSGYTRRVYLYLYIPLALISAGLTFVEVRLRHSTPYRRDGYYFMGVCAVFLLYALTNNGWGYTYNPLFCMLLFMSGWMIWDYGWLRRKAQEQGKNSRAFFSGQCGCVLNLALNILYGVICVETFFFPGPCTDSTECMRQSFVLEYLKKQRVQSFGTLAMNLKMWTDIARSSGASWNTRFNHLWMLPRLLQGGDAFTRQHAWIVDYVGKAMADDLNRRKPEIVFVDVSDGIFAYPHPVDLVGFLSRVPEFKAAWAHYRYQDTLNQCELAPGDKIRSLEDKRNSNDKPVFIDCRFVAYRHIP
jgi:hypothetical protein